MENSNESWNSDMENSEINSPNVEEPKNAQMKLFPIFYKNFRPKEKNPLLNDSKRGSPSRKRPRILLSKEVDGKQQMVLDAGQKHIGPQLCGECGLLYSPGDYDDEQEHRKAHIRLENTFQLTLWKEAQILFNYADSNSLILMVQSEKEKKIVKNRLRDFIAWLNSELGAGYDSMGFQNDERIFIYALRTKRKNVVRILGCIIAEVVNSKKISVSFLVHPQSDVNGIQSKSEVNSNSQLKPTIVLGITRLWTDGGFRRQKIASKLLDCLRFHSGIPGCVVSKDKIGILEPTDEGRSFMIKYTESKGCLYTYCK